MANDKEETVDPIAAPQALVDVAPEVQGTIFDQYDIALYACTELMRAIIESKTVQMFILDPVTKLPVLNPKHKVVNLQKSIDNVEAEAIKLRNRIKAHEDLAKKANQI